MNPLHGKVPVELDQTRHLMFSLNLIIDLEDEIGDLADLGVQMAKKGNMKFVRNLFTKLLNEGASEGEQPLTEEQVGKLIHMGNIAMVTNAIKDAYTIATKGEVSTLTEGEDNPDQESVENESSIDPIAGDNPN